MVVFASSCDSGVDVALLGKGFVKEGSEVETVSCAGAAAAAVGAAAVHMISKAVGGSGAVAFSCV